jgi:hypothetical protein
MRSFKFMQNRSKLLAFAGVACVLLVAIFAGVRIFAGDKVAVNTKTEAETAASGAKVTVPGGWKLFADKTVGVQFVYPASAGIFTSPAEKNPEFESSLESGKIAADFVPGVSGTFTVGTYKSSDAVIATRTYGPNIKFEKGQWVVTEPNQYDTAKYKKGDVFSELTRSNTHGVDVYTATRETEGVVRYSLYFVIHNKLHVIQLPAFNSDLESSSYNVNDQGPYNSMYTQIRDSISLY